MDVTAQGPYPFSPSLLSPLLRLAAATEEAADVVGLAEQACRILADSIPGSAVWVAAARSAGGLLEVVADAGFAPSLRQDLASLLQRDPASLPLGYRAHTQGTPQLVHSLQAGAAPDLASERALAMGCRAAAALPILVAGRSRGVLCLYLPDEGLLRGVNLELLRAAVGHLGMAIRRLEVEAERTRQLAVLKAIRSLTAESLRSAELGPLLHSTVQQAAELLDGSAAGMYLTEPDKKRVRCVVSIPSRPDYTGLVLRYGEGAAGTVAETGTPLLIPDYPSWPGRVEHLEEQGHLRSLLSAPMVAQGQVIGVIHIWRDVSRQPFSQEDVDLLLLFADQAAAVLENARHMQASQQRLRQLSLLSEITRLALELQDPIQMLQSMAPAMARLVEADTCCLALTESAGSPDAAPASAVHPPLTQRGTLPASWQALLASQEPSIVPEAIPPLDGAATEGVPTLRSYLALPLRAAGQHLGGALLGFVQPRPFSAEEISTCQQAADQVALALSQALALQAERRRTAELEALRQANLQLASKRELQPFLETILQQAIGLLGADDAHFFLYDGQQLTFAAALWAGGVQHQPYSYPRPEGLTYTVARTGQRIVIPDVNRHPLYQDYQWGGAIVGLPLRVGGQTRGVMTVAFNQPHAFSDNDLRPLELLADQAAIALENVQLFQATTAERQRLQLLYDITRALGASLEPTDILERATTLITTSLGGLLGVAFRIESKEDRPRLIAAAGKDAEAVAALDAALEASPAEALIAAVAARREPLLIPDILQDAQAAALQHIDERARCAMAAPILAGDSPLGVLALIHSQPSAFRAEQLDLLAAIARQVGLALTSASRHQETQRRLRELTLLQQVGQVINRHLEIQPLLEEVVRQVVDVLGYPMVEILLVEGDHLVLRASAGMTYPAPERVTLDRGMIGRVARTNQPAFAPDVRFDPDYIPTVPSTQAEIVVPLRKGGVVFGVLNVESPQRHSLTEDDVRLLTLLADQISVAIENAALYDHLRQHADALERTVSERTASLAEALEKARQADRIKSQFVSDVSHELRTPLSNIRLYLDLLSLGKPERFDDYVETLTRETERLMQLIEDLLAISRLDAKATAMHLAPVDLNGLAQGLVADRQRLFAARNITLTLQAERDLPVVMGDERMLSQVVANLLTNAMQYTLEGSVTVSTARRQDESGRWATLTVADTGLGIPEDEVPRLFERFFRGSSSRTVRAPGTGLGLAICKEIVERHGGRITVSSRLGSGSEFTVWLPAAPE